MTEAVNDEWEGDVYVLTQITIYYKMYTIVLFIRIPQGAP